MRFQSLLIPMVAVLLWPAQSLCLKVGYIDSRRVLLEYPEAVEAQGKFDSELQAWQEEAEAKRQEIEELERELEAQKLLLSDETRAEKESEIEQKKLEMTRFFDEIWGEA